MEGQGYEFMTVYDTIVSMGAESIHVPRMSSAWSSRWWWKGMGTPMISQIWERQISSRVSDSTEILLSLTTFKNVIVSSIECREQLSIQWELGIRDDGYVPGQVTYDARNIGLVQDSTLKDKFLSDPEFAFTLET